MITQGVFRPIPNQNQYCNVTDIVYEKASSGLHTEKYFQNLIKLNWNKILFTIFWLIWIQTDVRLDPNQSEHGKNNLISGWFNKIS